MSPTNSQPPNNPNDHAANLALATHISTQLAAPQQPQEAPQAPTGAPEDVTQIDLAPQVETMQKEIDSLKKQIQKDPKDDLAEIRQMVEQALGEEDTKENGK